MAAIINATKPGYLRLTPDHTQPTSNIQHPPKGSVIFVGEEVSLGKFFFTSDFMYESWVMSTDENTKGVNPDGSLFDLDTSAKIYEYLTLFPL